MVIRNCVRRSLFNGPMGQNPVPRGRGRCPLPFVAGKMPVPGQASSHGQSKERAKSTVAATCGFALQSVDRGLNGSTPLVTPPKLPAATSLTSDTLSVA